MNLFIMVLLLPVWTLSAMLSGGITIAITLYIKFIRYLRVPEDTVDKVIPYQHRAIDCTQMMIDCMEHTFKTMKK